MTTAFSPRTRSLLVRLGSFLSLSAFLLLAVSGCSGGGSNEASDSVSGKVTLGGEVVAGQVVFVGSDGKEYPTPIQIDGIYVLAKPPVGQVKVLVKGTLAGVGLPGATLPKDGAAMPKTGGATPPAKYGDAKTTPLTYEVKSGKHTYDIPLTK